MPNKTLDCLDMEFDNSKSLYVPREMYEQEKALADKRLVLLKEAFELIDRQYGEGISNGYWPTIAPLHKKLAEAIDAA